MTRRSGSATRCVVVLYACALLAAVAALGFCPAASAAVEGPERILDFESVVEVKEDASITVTETITVVSRGRDIQRGIYRDFPTEYSGAYGEREVRGFEVLAVERDGEPEQYHTESISNGVRVYIGQQNVFLEPGEHTFTLVYRSTGQVGYFDAYDELYWNVTGNFWTFAIERASCTIRLPNGASVLQVAAYTGPAGAKGTNYIAGFDDQGDPHFETTAPLPPSHGLTVAVAWPKGIVAEPTDTEKFMQGLRANMSSVIVLLAATVLFLYYYVAWFKVGRDPEKGTPFPRFRPPHGVSPAGARTIMRMGYDNKAFAAAVVNMAVKGYVEISQEKALLGSTSFTLTRTGKTARECNLSRGEKLAADALFAGSDIAGISRSNRINIRRAAKRLSTFLELEHEKVHFLTNKQWLIPGIAITLFTLVALALASRQPPVAGFLSLWLAGWTTGVTFLLLTAYRLFRSGSIAAGLFSSLFAIPFVAGELFGLFAYSQVTSMPATAGIIMLFLLNGLFYFLLKAPTIEGRTIMDEIEGYKLFLETTEKDRLNIMNPPDVTPEVFEKHLPYAMALDVENKWSQRFESQLERMGQPSSTYSPHWYHGSGGMRGLSAGAFASSFSGAFTNAVASSSSSSGSGGGGSSGGGGGGGGGGGW
ncbi:DUF2207 domain-containing protein [Oceanidesulfovibrio indonesiensis]|nr:DUF2207 domain-containing protein [Oceanidesulfovibrio indonesiensis]